ncbi:hypothetical protein N7462_009071 [Penicillium macrosclerotiorum]|uniref:uncharacterized protein n=1 Tax=Penicillium macrosclerotiorum TaxID=303699 RepID=UPI0025466868|nr:uncharacterized protein N7462_009071 [Penicillium macrosclerotiorum]KAJ5676174.1 hypothetical protein N7462_009071 [Penicillium macrosclerotiorum]
MSRTELNDGFSGFNVDSESLRSFSETLPDEYHEWVSESGRNSRSDRSSNEQILDDFPNPPSKAKTLDAIAEENTYLSSQPDLLTQPDEQAYPTPKPSIKNMRRTVTTNELPLLQELNPFNGAEEFNPVNEEGASYDLIAPWDGVDAPLHKLERLSDVMFGTEHMLHILNNPRYLARFREFLLEERPRSISTLTYYLNAAKALKALEYANSLVRLSIDIPPPAVQILQTDTDAVGVTTNQILEQRVQDGLKALTAEELPAFITSRCITITSKIVEERVRGTLPMKFRDTSNALAEVFCLTDPSRPDNPIIFASEEFHRTTQYGMDYVLGRNCRFLQGPQTNPNSVRRIREALNAGRHHSELFLNYRRDGSPFMNLLQCAPLCDSKGNVKYVIGAQIDVSGLALDGAQMESLIELQSRYRDPDEESIAEMPEPEHKDEFQQMCELFSPRELSTIQDHGGDLFQPLNTRVPSRTKRHWLQRGGSMDSETEAIRLRDLKSPLLRGSLTGVYENYLLVRPYPSLRILFTSPSLQIPGMLQSSFLSRIGSTSAVKEELMAAMQHGRSVTARIKWVTRFNTEGRNRWVHCTPLYASNGQVGVWMVVIVDDDDEAIVNWRN